MYGLKSDYPLHLQVTTPKGAALDRYVEPVTLTVMESFSIPDGLDEVFLWDAMLAKQYLTIAQGYFRQEPAIAQSTLPHTVVCWMNQKSTTKKGKNCS